MQQRYFGFAVLLLLMFLMSSLRAGTTGKIVGRVLDKQTGEALPGINVYMEGTSHGAATDNDGFYLINNIPPGSYTVVFTAIG